MTASMHHEIMTPLKVNIALAENLSTLLDVTDLKEMAQMISVSSKLILFHANDMLDHRIIEHGGFAPAYVHASVPDALLEIVLMMRWLIKHLDLNIRLSSNESVEGKLYFDRRRLQ